MFSLKGLHASEQDAKKIKVVEKDENREKDLFLRQGWKDIKFIPLHGIPVSPPTLSVPRVKEDTGNKHEKDLMVYI